jgi:predicted dithiol-disulfide oxidoreductase (DUF899 family)
VSQAGRGRRATSGRGPRQGRSALRYAPSDPGQDPRHVGTIETLWNLFDLTPEGRPTGWHEQLAYR